jgi:D-galactose 1-dehydrogenase
MNLAEQASEPIRIALVGTGKVARDFHLPALALSPQVALVGSVDRKGIGIEGVPVYTSIADALRQISDLQALVLCTPPDGRHEQALAALHRGIHVFLEKPPAASMSAIRAMQEAATRANVTLFASWHSRHAPAVDPARLWLRDRKIRSVEIVWGENVRQWHPGQDWILDRSGLGVFDPGINALSIVTAVLPTPVFLESAVLNVPANRSAPVSASMKLRDADATPITADFDFLRAGAPRWDIVVHTADGVIEITERGFALSIDGDAVPLPAEQEYRSLYSRFVELIRNGESDVDARPLELVADAFLLGQIREAAPLHW